MIAKYFKKVLTKTSPGMYFKTSENHEMKI